MWETPARRAAGLLLGIGLGFTGTNESVQAVTTVVLLALSLLGGLLGVAVGLAVSAGIAQFAGWSFAFSPTTLLAAVLSSVLVGVVFGVWPARQAARLDPIAALRYE